MPFTKHAAAGLLTILAVACAATPADPPYDDPAFWHATPGRDSSPDLNAQIEEWIAPVEPFTIWENVHFVGAAGVSSFLITTPQGHVLIDGGLAEMAIPIQRNIERLGYDVRDVRFILNSHAHWDHAGGIAALKAASGAHLIASAADAFVLSNGHIAYGPASAVDFAPVAVDHVIGDGETVDLGGTSLRAHITPGHTRGCTSWATTTSGPNPRTVLFHCSSSTGGQSLAPEAYPGIVADYRRTFDEIIPELSAQIFLANHPMFFNMAEKRARQQAGEADAFVDHRELQMFNAAMREAFETERARQEAAAAP
ncbi:MAG: subclass B3 metallo-beta-lactamase [Alphaproteobacteria bacterium]|nr:subclass B3 metallo-beta-lactamase [Alphaproteobacteria bacterium]